MTYFVVFSICLKAREPSRVSIRLSFTKTINQAPKIALHFKRLYSCFSPRQFDRTFDPPTDYFRFPWLALMCCKVLTSEKKTRQWQRFALHIYNFLIEKKFVNGNLNHAGYSKLIKGPLLVGRIILTNLLYCLEQR